MRYLPGSIILIKDIAATRRYAEFSVGKLHSLIGSVHMVVEPLEYSNCGDLLCLRVDDSYLWVHIDDVEAVFEAKSHDFTAIDVANLQQFAIDNVRRAGCVNRESELYKRSSSCIDTVLRVLVLLQEVPSPELLNAVVSHCDRKRGITQEGMLVNIEQQRVWCSSDSPLDERGGVCKSGRSYRQSI